MTQLTRSDLDTEELKLLATHYAAERFRCDAFYFVTGTTDRRRSLASTYATERLKQIADVLGGDRVKELVREAEGGPYDTASLRWRVYWHGTEAEFDAVMGYPCRWTEEQIETFGCKWLLHQAGCDPERLDGPSEDPKPPDKSGTQTPQDGPELELIGHLFSQDSATQGFEESQKPVRDTVNHRAVGHDVETERTTDQRSRTSSTQSSISEEGTDV